MIFIDTLLFVGVIILLSLFRIREILIQFGILGSVLWPTDPDTTQDPDPALFGSVVEG
jgi:hypothetical protein